MTGGLEKKNHDKRISWNHKKNKEWKNVLYVVIQCCNPEGWEKSEC
jgi:hypothetical protein